MKVVIGKKSQTSSVPIIGENGDITVFDKICSFVFAVSPLLQHYKGVYDNAGFTAILAVLPIILLRLLSKLRISRRRLCAILPVVLYQLYSMANRSFSVMTLFYYGFMCVMFLAIAAGCVNINYVFQYALRIAATASLIVILIQYPSYYVFHRVFRPVAIRFLLPGESDRWNYIRGYVSGSMYRPAAFFLEPSHMFLYCFPIILLLLFTPGRTVRNVRTAALISVGVVLSTSGMGIMVVTGIWILYFAVYKSQVIAKKEVLKKIFSLKSILVFVLVLVLFLAAFSTVGVFRKSVLRIFVNENGSTAIDGRIRLARNFIRRLSTRQKLFGSDTRVSGITFNMSGFSATLIKTGLVGVILTYWFYGQGLWKLDGAYFWMTLIILVVSFFSAHTHGTFFMLYYSGFLLNGYGSRRETSRGKTNTNGSQDRAGNEDKSGTVLILGNLRRFS